MNVNLRQPPSGWGDDSLSEFIDKTRNNVFASFERLRPQYKRLADIDSAFRVIGQNLDNPPDWFTALFLFRAHSSYLGGAHLALAGQLPEAYMLLRGCLENGLYAFYFHRNPDSRDRWLRRHEGNSAKKTVQSEFQIRALLRLLDRHEGKVAVVARDLYERTIDFGGHPNERALTQVLKLSKSDDGRRLDLNYLTGHTEAMDLCLKTTMQVGVWALMVFDRVFPERFALLGLSDSLKHLQEGL